MSHSQVSTNEAKDLESRKTARTRGGIAKDTRRSIGIAIKYTTKIRALLWKCLFVDKIKLGLTHARFEGSGALKKIQIITIAINFPNSFLITPISIRITIVIKKLKSILPIALRLPFHRS